MVSRRVFNKKRFDRTLTLQLCWSWYIWYMVWNIVHWPGLHTCTCILLWGTRFSESSIKIWFTKYISGINICFSLYIISCVCFICYTWYSTWCIHPGYIRECLQVVKKWDTLNFIGLDVLDKVYIYITMFYGSRCEDIRSSTHPPIHPSIQPSNQPTNQPSICLSAQPSIHLFHISIYLSDWSPQVLYHPKIQCQYRQI